MTNPILDLTKNIYTKIDLFRQENDINEDSIASLSFDLGSIVLEIISTIRTKHYRGNDVEKLKTSESYTMLDYHRRRVDELYLNHIVTSLSSQNIDEIEAKLLKFTKENDLVDKENLQARLYDLLSDSLFLDHDAHIDFIKSHLWQRGVEGIPRALDIFYLDPSRPWILYWIVHSLDLLSQSLSPKLQEMIIASIDSFWSKTGGYGGGPGQIGHVITTYVSVCLQCIVGLENCNTRRNEVHDFLLQRKLENSAFEVHENGEYDTRSTYCAIATASMLNILSDELIEGVADYIKSCQSFDGGLAGQPDLESHAAYTFCGFATLCILKKHDIINSEKLKRWCFKRLMVREFGFQGRPNKLVDSCYSYWLGATLYLLYQNGAVSHSELVEVLSWSKMYLLLIAQTEGGFRDKIGKGPDLYHTCYSLSSLALTDELLGKPCKLLPVDPLHITKRELLPAPCYLD